MVALKDKNIVLGVTGSIAAYKSAELLRLLMTAGAKVTVVMTESATRFIGPQTMSALSGRRVITRMFGDGTDPEMDHIRVPENADAFLIAPATANVMARMAAGIADDILTSMLLVARCPVLVAPAMNSNMIAHPATVENMDKLRSRGIRVVESGVGQLACGYEGPGRLAPVEDIIEELKASMTPQDMAGVRVLVTAGPTREAMDPVRYLSNRSSGKMGYAIARAALRHGADVTLVSGPTGFTAPFKAALVNVETAEEMLEACREDFDKYDALIMAAAVADYKPSIRADSKIKRSAEAMTLDLAPCPDILKSLNGPRSPGQVIVGFAAETDNVLENAKSKLESKGLDLLVANRVNTPDSGFEHDTNRIQVLDADGGIKSYPLLTKEEAAERVMGHVVEWLGKKKG